MGEGRRGKTSLDFSTRPSPPTYSPTLSLPSFQMLRRLYVHCILCRLLTDGHQLHAVRTHENWGANHTTLPFFNHCSRSYINCSVKTMILSYSKLDLFYGFPGASLPVVKREQNLFGHIKPDSIIMSNVYPITSITAQRPQPLLRQDIYHHAILYF